MTSESVTNGNNDTICTLPGEYLTNRPLEEMHGPLFGWPYQRLGAMSEQQCDTECRSVWCLESYVSDTGDCILLLSEETPWGEIFCEQEFQGVRYSRQCVRE